MIDRLRLFTRMATFAAAFWILVVVIWGLITPGNHVETPQIAVWLFICGLVAQLGLWLVSKAARRS